jgi:D-glycero-D-manno-heptose 1,7-bisphosphate phosphatase
MENALIVLDRDGVINKLLIRPDGSTDSPMNFDEIEIFPWVPEQLKILHNDLKYGIVIATNQPAAAKGKISHKDLFDIGFEIEYLAQAKYKYVTILESFMCFHKKEDNCNCRKPKTGLLEKAFTRYNNFRPKYSWMVGDRATDVIAGHTFGLNTALLGPSVDSDMDLLRSLNINPTYHGKDLRDFVKMISE